MSLLAENGMMRNRIPLNTRASGLGTGVSTLKLIKSRSISNMAGLKLGWSTGDSARLGGGEAEGRIRQPFAFFQSSPHIIFHKNRQPGRDLQPGEPVTNTANEKIRTIPNPTGVFFGPPDKSRVMIRGPRIFGSLLGHSSLRMVLRRRHLFMPAKRGRRLSDV
jgi:hypothetical protein